LLKAIQPWFCNQTLDQLRDKIVMQPMLATVPLTSRQFSSPALIDVKFNAAMDIDGDTAVAIAVIVDAIPNRIAKRS